MGLSEFWAFWLQDPCLESEELALRQHKSFARHEVRIDTSFGKQKSLKARSMEHRHEDGETFDCRGCILRTAEKPVHETKEKNSDKKADVKSESVDDNPLGANYVVD